MAITRGTVVSGAAAAAATQTLASVACTGTDRYLEVAIALPSTNTVSSVVFNGSESLTKIDHSAWTGASPVRLEVWALVNPSATTADVVITYATSLFACAQAHPFAGVDQTTPRDTLIKANANTSPVTLTGTITWGGGDDVVQLWAAHRPSNRTWTADAGVTQILNNESGSGTSHADLISLYDTDTETDKVLGTVSGSSPSNACLGYNLNAAAGGGYTLTAANGTYTASGQAAGLLASRTVGAASGTYTLTGQAATPLAARVVSASGGTYFLAGQDAALVYTPAGAYTLSAGMGAYALTGQAATLRAARSLTAAQGSFTLAGQAAALLRARVLVGSPGTYALAGQAATLRVARALVAARGLYQLTGLDASLVYSGAAAPYVGMVRLTAARGPAFAFYAAAGPACTFTAGDGPALRLTPREPTP